MPPLFTAGSKRLPRLPQSTYPHRQCDAQLLKRYAHSFPLRARVQEIRALDKNRAQKKKAAAEATPFLDFPYISIYSD